MPKNQLNKDELVCHILKLKTAVDEEPKTVWQGEKDLAHKYLNRVLNRIQEYDLDKLLPRPKMCSQLD